MGRGRVVRRYAFLVVGHEVEHGEEPIIALLVSQSILVNLLTYKLGMDVVLVQAQSGFHVVLLVFDFLPINTLKPSVLFHCLHTGQSSLGILLN